MRICTGRQWTRLRLFIPGCPSADTSSLTITGFRSVERQSTRIDTSTALQTRYSGSAARSRTGAAAAKSTQEPQAFAESAAVSPGRDAYVDDIVRVAVYTGKNRGLGGALDERVDGIQRVEVGRRAYIAVNEAHAGLSQPPEIELRPAPFQVVKGDEFPCSVARSERDRKVRAYEARASSEEYPHDGLRGLRVGIR